MSKLKKKVHPKPVFHVTGLHPCPFCNSVPKMVQNKKNGLEVSHCAISIGIGACTEPCDFEIMAELLKEKWNTAAETMQDFINSRRK